ncbi:hypothetical protein EC3006_2885 [Escherichia coli 3006]|nr:hypothetical protein EC3006_2885 [Escherichia coli 3006]
MPDEKNNGMFLVNLSDIIHIKSDWSSYNVYDGYRNDYDK